MSSKNEFIILGKVGLFNLSLLGCIVIWRTIRFIQNQMSEMRRYSVKRKLVFHIFLLSAIIVDIPMYVQFLQYQDYALITYSFHKLESAFLFAAFSITVNDWTSVLYDIHEYNLYPFLVRKATLIVINVIYFLISILNVIFCFTLSDFNSYTSSAVYLTGLFLQVTMSVVLTLFMLSAGLRLSYRLKGVVGEDIPNPNPLHHIMHRNKPMNVHHPSTNSINNNDTENGNNQYRRLHVVTSESDTAEDECRRLTFTSNSNDENNNTTIAPLLSPMSDYTQTMSARESLIDRRISYEGQKEFRQAIRNLNIVMATCAICFLTQSILLVANYSLGYESSTSETVGPLFFYWTCYFWLPLWGVTLSLLYLAKTHSQRNNLKGSSYSVNKAATAKHHSNSYDPGDNSANYSDPLLTQSSQSLVGPASNNNLYCSPYVTAGGGDTPSSRSHSQSTRNTLYSGYNSRTPSVSASSSSILLPSNEKSLYTTPNHNNNNNPIRKNSAATMYSDEQQQLSHSSIANFDNQQYSSSIHTEEDLFGEVFSPENSLHYYYRESNSYNMTTSNLHQQHQQLSDQSDDNCHNSNSQNSTIKSLVSGFHSQLQLQYP